MLDVMSLNVITLICFKANRIIWEISGHKTARSLVHLSVVLLRQPLKGDRNILTMSANVRAGHQLDSRRENNGLRL